MTLKGIIMRRWRKFYLAYVLIFKRSAVKESLNRRYEIYPKEYCIKCHACCYGCVNLQDDGTCKIWNDADYRCKTGPFFEWEFKYAKCGDCTQKCRYRWRTKKVKP